MKKLIFALSSAGANGGLIIEKNLVTNHMEANRKSITVKDGIGREVNPYSPYDPTHEPNSDLSRFDYFAKHNVGYPCPELADTKPGETVQGELVWRHPNDYGGYTYTEQMTGYVAEEQIWRLVPKEEKLSEQEKVNKSDVLKILEDARIMAVKKNSHAGDYAENVLYDIIQEIESLTPPTLK